MHDLINRKAIAQNSFLLFVNDGSSDTTWDLIEAACANDPLCRGIKLARNVGHQNALLAGLHHVKDQCDAAISIDADLQDDINVIVEMIRKYGKAVKSSMACAVKEKPIPSLKDLPHRVFINSLASWV